LGLKVARSRGRTGGRPSKITEGNIRLAKTLHADKKKNRRYTPYSWGE
jgi:hypothetical protein